MKIKFFIAVWLLFFVLLFPKQVVGFEFNLPPTRIIIPSVGISLPVYLAKESFDTWEVRLDGASYGEFTELPGKNGNTVIFSHARKGLFINLTKIKKDDKIHVFTEKDWFVYKVIDTMSIDPENIEVIFSKGKHELTLFTCTGENYSKRFIVKTELIQNLVPFQELK